MVCTGENVPGRDARCCLSNLSCKFLWQPSCTVSLLSGAFCSFPWSFAWDSHSETQEERLGSRFLGFARFLWFCKWIYNASEPRRVVSHLLIAIAIVINETKFYPNYTAQSGVRLYTCQDCRSQSSNARNTLVKIESVLGMLILTTSKIRNYLRNVSQITCQEWQPWSGRVSGYQVVNLDSTSLSASNVTPTSPIGWINKFAAG